MRKQSNHLYTLTRERVYQEFYVSFEVTLAIAIAITTRWTLPAGEPTSTRRSGAQPCVPEPNIADKSPQHHAGEGE